MKEKIRDSFNLQYYERGDYYVEVKLPVCKNSPKNER